MVAKVTAPSGTPNAALNTNVANRQSTAAQEQAVQTVYQDDLLSYVVYLAQEKFKPNKDEGVTFYYGVITNIIDEETKTYDKRDIFYSKMDGVERINNTTTKDNSKRKIFLVHIPALFSILFSGELANDKKDLSAPDFYKFRIENTTDNISSLSVGNIVKIKFENNLVFENGVIEQKVDDGILSLKLPPTQDLEAKKKFEDYVNCIKEPINNSTGQSRTLFVSTLTKNGINSLGLFDFLEIFCTRDYVNAETKNVPTSQKVSYIIKSSENTHNQIVSFKATNSDFNAVPVSVEQTDKFFIQPEKTILENNKLIIKISAESYSKNLASFFASFISSTYYTKAIPSNDEIVITFEIDAITKEDFYTFSQGRYLTLKEFNIEPSTVSFTQEQIKNAEQPKQNVQAQKCEQAVILDLYTDISKEQWKRRNDQILIDHFFNKKPVASSDKQLLQYDKHTILDSYAVMNLSEYPDNKIVGSNKDVYFLGDSIFEQNPLSGKASKISVEKIKSNLKFLRKDMETLRNYISINEGVTDQSILILPTKWFETKPRGAVPKNRDESSQLWFGRSVQFVVYIKIENKIYQIPPEIVFLYVYKSLSNNGQRKIGAGVFTSKGFYTQYENLDGIKIKDPEERYWTEKAPGGDDLEKALNNVSSNDFIKTLQEYVRNKYLSQIFGTPQKIRNLL
jgi:hypothetical protein